jgi:hypothetical protein
MKTNMKTISIVVMLGLIFTTSVVNAENISAASGNGSENVSSVKSNGLGTPNIEIIDSYISPSNISIDNLAILGITVKETLGDDWAKDVTVTADVLNPDGVTFTDTLNSHAEHYLGNIARLSTGSTLFTIYAPTSVTLGQKTIRITVKWYETNWFDTGTIGPYFTYLDVSFMVVGDRLNPGDRLRLGHRLSSQNGQYNLSLYANGDLVLYAGNSKLWVSDTSNIGIAYAKMQEDGNFVFSDINGVVLWSSGTQGYNGASLIVSNDGALVVYDTNNIVRWRVPSIKGDVNIDGAVTVADALLYLRYSVGQNISPYHIDISNDVTCEIPPTITVADALLVLRKSVGQNVNLQC